MKTKIRTFIGITALGLFGFVNINAAFVNTVGIDYKRLVNADVATETEESMTIESWMLNNEHWTPKATIETLESDQPIEIEGWMTDEELFFKEAESFTASGADSEIAKCSKKQVALKELRSGK